MKFRFVLFTAMRYLKARRRSKGFTSSLLSILGVALGIMTLMTVIAVMNGFQLTYINNLIEVSSYHVQLVGDTNKILDENMLDAIRLLPRVRAVVPFKEFQVIIDRVSQRSETMPGIVRAVDVESALSDDSFMSSLFGSYMPRDEYKGFNFEPATTREFDIQDPNTIAIGMLLAQYLGVRVGSEIVISSVNDISLKANTQTAGDAASRIFRVSSIFKTGYRDIDQYYLFMSIKNSSVFDPVDSSFPPFPIRYGVKLEDRFKDLSSKKEIEHIVAGSHFEVKTWRDFNKSFFGALLTEKMAMMLLVGLIFIVVGFNIFNSLRRIVYEKYEEIGLLKAIGASPERIRTIFIFEGLLIGFSGGLAGIVLGLFISMNINGVFSFFTDLANAGITFVQKALSAFGLRITPGHLESPFSPRVFYLSRVPSVVIFEEAVFIFLFALLSSIGAAFLASKKVSEVKPSEVLRYE